MSSNQSSTLHHLTNDTQKVVIGSAYFRSFKAKEKMNLLLVEDDEAISQGLATALSQDAYNVETLADGQKADDILQTKKFDLVILDLTLPHLDGSEVLRRLRARNDFTPVVVLTARTTAQDRIFGLDAGADDYITKPFELGELEARVRAILRRNSGQARSELATGMEIDQVNHSILFGTNKVNFSPREFAIIHVLIKNSNKVVTREDLISALSSTAGDEVGENALEVYVHRLRKKLESTGAELKTLRGLGYMFICNV